MSTRHCWLLVAVATSLLCMVAAGQRDGAANADRLKQYLERFPDADANGDGTLTMEEVQQHRRQQQAGGRQQQAGGRQPQPRPEPDVADVAYGPNEKQRFDLWLAESDEPTPLILFIHGGGFRGGDKQGINLGVLRQAQANGISYASLNYRLTPEITSPQPFLDCALALQTIRDRAEEWNIDPERIASTGGSAGAGISLWLAFHDDMADADAEDPIAHQSTRLVCAAVSAGQCSYDPFFCESIGLPRLMEHAFFYPFYGIEEGEEESEEAKRRYAEASPITYLTEDDVPVMMDYGQPNEPVTEETSLNAIVHHPQFGVTLQEHMDELGLRCVVRWRGQEGVEPITAFDFIKGYLLPETE
jgi:acetyl esterase/lipase